MVKNTINEIITEGKMIEHSRKVFDLVKDNAYIEVSEKLVRKVLKKDFKLSYVKTKKLNRQANSVKNLVVR